MAETLPVNGPGDTHCPCGNRQ